MRVLIKVGGTLLDGAATRAALSERLAAIARTHQVVIVHGGGKQMTRFLEERGIQSSFVNGLRVSDEAVIDAATKVIAGAVNKQFVSALSAAGGCALGLSGVDGGLTAAVQMDPALAFVGRPVSSNGPLLDLLVQHGYLPVIACIAADANGTIYNVNADQMAVSCALAFKADLLVFLTDVPGVRNAAGEVVPHLSETEVEAMIRSGVAHGGMQAKLEAALSGLTGGIHQVVIAPGADPEVFSRVLTGAEVGTTLSLSPQVASQ